MLALQGVTSIAHPLQGLVCAHGYKNKRLHTLPVESIFVSLEALYTKVSFTFLDSYTNKPIIISNGREVPEESYFRIISFIKRVLTIFEAARSYRIEIEQNFPIGIGIGSSAALFAAITLSIVHTLKKNLTSKELSCLARLGSYSAASAIVGNVSVVRTGLSDLDNFAEIICKKDDFPYRIIVLPIKGKKLSEKIHLEMKDSPFYKKWLKGAKSVSQKVQDSIRARNFEKLGHYVEPYIYENFATISTGPSHLLSWNSETLEKIMFLRSLREEKKMKFFIAMNSGPAVFIYTESNNLDSVVSVLQKFKVECIPTGVGGGAFIEKN